MFQQFTYFGSGSHHCSLQIIHGLYIHLFHFLKFQQLGILNQVLTHILIIKNPKQYHTFHIGNLEVEEESALTTADNSIQYVCRNVKNGSYYVFIMFTVYISFVVGNDNCVFLCSFSSDIPKLLTANCAYKRHSVSYSIVKQIYFSNKINLESLGAWMIILNSKLTLSQSIICTQNTNTSHFTEQLVFIFMTHRIWGLLMLNKSCNQQWMFSDFQCTFI